MARFVVYAHSEGPGYLLDVQANLLSHLNTRMVVPLLPAGEAPRPAHTLNPVIELEGVRHVMVTQFMAAVPLRVLQAPVADLQDRAPELIAALNCLFQGV